MVVPKKNGKLRACANLKNGNVASVYDHYPFMITKHVLEWVVCKRSYIFLDGFSSYKHFSIKEEDQHKMVFAREWGIYVYTVMAFGLQQLFKDS